MNQQRKKALMIKKRFERMENDSYVYMWEVRDMQSAIHKKKEFVLEPLHKASKVPCAAEKFRRITAEFLLEEEANFTMLMIMIMIMTMIMMIMMMVVMVMVMMVIVMMIIMKRKTGFLQNTKWDSYAAVSKYASNYGK